MQAPRVIELTWMKPSLRWTIVALLCLAMVIGLLDRINFSVALALKEFQARFSLTDQDRGLLNSAFFWTYTCLQAPAGWIVDRYGVKRLFTVAVALWGLVTAATAIVTFAWQLIALRLLLGASEALLTPASMRWIRMNCREDQRGIAIGIVMAGTKIGPAIGAWLSAALITMYGWQTMFVLLGLCSFVWLVPWIGLAQDGDAAPVTIKPAQPQATIRDLFRNPILWGTLIGAFCYQYYVNFCITWMPAYFVDRHGLTLNSMGLYTMFSFGGMAVIATVAGYAADRLIARGYNAPLVRKTFVIAGLAIASTELLGAVVDSQSLAIVFAIVSLSGLGLATANAWALTQTLIPGHLVGRVVGLQALAASAPGIVAPLLTGWLKEITGGYTAPFQLICALLITGLLSYLFLVREKYANQWVESAALAGDPQHA
jgi:ACS family D-galactonate transporter-like MFS transporter